MSMQFPGVPATVAPFATGHPSGLPAAPTPPARETVVQPASKPLPADPEPGGLPPSSFWRTLSGLPDPRNHSAPPSIMQLRITAILDEQVEHLREAEPETATDPASSSQEDRDEPPRTDRVDPANAP
ncbi:hypothetical protein [Salipiger marinus]|uniref:Uncharacterized protein n=1 Tax=Salipiger marinus TaxID=555512 RepID=A0A1G8Q7T6_9RHOB|nr:hypothetical protein [Salipiger marinus]SDJ00545.1 hypothetical protein SAMN04487993_1014135 [Salipiger marinus]